MATPGDKDRSDQDKVIERTLSQILRKIIVMSGKGGVGKSTLAGMIAIILSNTGRSVGLLDIDLHGPSIPTLMNVQGGLDISEGVVRPYRFSDNLGIVSIGMLTGEKDAAVIWRGPLKIGAIRQFISDIEWGELDFLIVDSPPGTGDEPITVAQTIEDAEALVVTTPQEISLADVRKSINFCRHVNMRVLGVVENMSGFSCPHCEERIDLFGQGGGEKMADMMGVPMMGAIPIDPEIVELADRGGLEGILTRPDPKVRMAYEQVVARIISPILY